MAQAKNIFEQLKVDAQQRQQLEKLDKKRMVLEEESKRDISDYKVTLDKMLSGEKQVDVKELSRLDAGIQRGEKYKVEISDLAESLTSELSDLGQLFGDLSQYKGAIEGVAAKIGLKRYADKRRLARVKSADVKENLKTILDYGTHMVAKLQAAILDNMDCRVEIEGTLNHTTDKLRENQPKYEESRSQREALEGRLEEVRNRFDAADETERAKIAGEREKLEREVLEIKTTENYYFTIVDKARQAAPIQRIHLQSYSTMIDALIQLKTGLEQNIENVTSMYNSVPVAIKTALGVKAASQYDKGMKYATDKSTEVVLASVAGVLDEGASRNERPLIEPDKLEFYRKARAELQREFETRISAIKEKHKVASASN